MSKLKVDELQESTTDSNITVASGTNLVVTDSLTVGGAAPYTAGGTDVPITDGGTGASSATAAASALGVGTEDSPQFTAVNVGNASDTTLSRASAGVLQVESSELYMAGGTDVAVADGGTGAGTATAGFDALSPMTTVGDIMYGGSSGTVTRLAASTDGHVLTSTGAGSAPAWEAAGSGGDVSKVGTPANNQVGIWTGDGTIEGDSNITYDGTTFTVNDAFTMGSNSQFKELAHATGNWANTTYVTVHTAGATEDGVWWVMMTCTYAAPQGSWLFKSAGSGGTHINAEFGTANNAQVRWSGDNLQISHSQGGDADVAWVVYQLHKRD